MHFFLSFLSEGNSAKDRKARLFELGFLEIIQSTFVTSFSKGQYNVRSPGPAGAFADPCLVPDLGWSLHVSHAKTAHDPANRITLDVSRRLESGSGPSQPAVLASSISARYWCRRKATHVESRRPSPTHSLRADFCPHSQS